MGVTYEDVKHRLEAQARKHHARRGEQAKIAQGVGQAMAELLADPKWQLFCNHMQAVLEVEEARLVRFRETLSGMKFLSEQETGQARVDAAHAKGYSEALKWAMGLAKELVDVGEAAKETLAMGGTQGA